jgi:hypothetical protein
LVGMSPLAYFTGSYDLIDQKFGKHDQFLQWESDMMSTSSDRWQAEGAST